MANASRFRELHSKAFMNIKIGLEYEEGGQESDALGFYRTGVAHMKEALNIPLGSLGNDPELKTLYSKMHDNYGRFTVHAAKLASRIEKESKELGDQARTELHEESRASFLGRRRKPAMPKSEVLRPSDLAAAEKRIAEGKGVGMTGVGKNARKIKGVALRPKSPRPKSPRPSASNRRTPNGRTTSTPGQTAYGGRSGIPQSDKAKSIDPAMREHIMNEVLDQGGNVKWEDVAGLAGAKKVLYELVVLPSLRPDMFTGLRAPPRGLLLFGPPGNGKTMLAKAVASETKATFFAISASSIVSKWVGESEKLMRTLFALADEMQPSVIFIDEIDSILSARSANEHEASRRLKTEFLVQVDGVGSDSASRVLIMGATNRPEELDEAVRRRFTKRVYIPLPDADARKALLTNMMKGARTSLCESEIEEIVGLTKDFSASDLTALCKDAALGPIRELGKKLVSVKERDVRPLDITDFRASLRAMRPSVSHKQIGELERWNMEFGTGLSTSGI